MRVARDPGMRTPLLCLGLVAFLPALALAEPEPPSRHPQASPTLQRPAKGDLQLTSRAFGPDSELPKQFTCDGAGKSPPLAWSRAPTGTKSIAVMVTDPEAPKGTFTHWLVTDLPPTATSLPSGGSLPSGAIAAKNDGGRTGYTAPCPPSGTHHYYFQVYALDIRLPRAMSRGDFLAAIDGHVIADGKLVATYHR